MLAAPGRPAVLVSDGAAWFAMLFSESRKRKARERFELHQSSNLAACPRFTLPPDG
jgi:hypothetical protein